MAIVSIIIPCYNQGDFLLETLNSAKNQTYPNIEIIVVDDGSTDSSTREVLEGIMKDKSIILKRIPNSGVSLARNEGIKIARGDYILPLDGDDIIYPTYIEKALRKIEFDPNLGIVYCKAEFFGKKKGYWDLPPYSESLLVTDNMIFCSAMFRKKDWELVGGFRENMIFGMEDYDFWVAIVNLGRKVYQIPEILFRYRVKNESRTTSLAEGEKENLMFTNVFYNNKDFFLKNNNMYYLISSRRNLLKENAYLKKYRSINFIKFVNQKFGLKSKFNKGQ